MKEAVEQALGFGLSEFRRLKGGSSPNFKAVRSSDGLPFLVKLLPKERQWAYPILVAHLDEMRGTSAVRRVFIEAPEDVGDYKLICLEWCEGAVKMPYQLTAPQLREFVDFYVRFSKSFQRVSYVAEADSLSRWRDNILACRGVVAAPVRRFILRELPEIECTYRVEEMRTIFGDFHHGNVLFRDGRVHRVLDLESFCRGYPTDDLVRYFTCAYDHLKWAAPFRRGAMLRAFAETLQYAPYSRHEWIVSLNSIILRRLSDVVDHPNNPFFVANLLYRVRFYLDLKMVVSRILQ